MIWFPLALVSAAATSLVGIIDKVLVERYLRDNWSYPLLTAAFLGMYAVILLATRAYLGLLRVPSGPALVVALLPGLLQYIASFFYVRALLQTDAAVVAALNQTGPLFSVLWGWLFFGDVFGPYSYIGILVIVLCSVLLSMEQASTTSRHRLNSALLLIMIGAALRTLGDVGVKTTLSSQDYWNTFGLSRAMLLPISVSLLFHPDYRRLLARSIRANGYVLLPGIAALELFVTVPILLGVAAYARGPLALVASILYTTPLFVLVFTVLLNRLHPGLVPERTGRRSLLERATLTTGILAGAMMLRVLRA